MAKESSASRRARVKFQLRDRKGRWIEMGRGVKWYSPRLKREVSGTVVGAKGPNALVNITSEPNGKGGKPQQVSVKGSDIEVISNKATIGKTAEPSAKPKQDIPTGKAKLDLERRQKAVSAPAETDKESDEDMADPDLADLEDEDLNLDDLEDDEPTEEEEASSGPTDFESIEATTEELEAVLEEIESGDLDAGEISEKLEEEVYELVGQDESVYSLDLKKSDGRWNYRMKDADGETRLMVPADENDATDAATKLDRAMNNLTKAKTPAPKKDTPASEPKSEEAPVEKKPAADLPPLTEGEQKGLFAEPKRENRKTIAQTRKEFEGLPEGTKIHFADAMGENEESYQKFKDAQDEDVWAKMEDSEEDIDPRFYTEKSDSQDERELMTNAEMAKANRDRPYDKEVPPTYDNREAVRKEANEKRLKEPVKHDIPLVKGDNKAGTDPDATPEPEEEEEYEDDDQQTDEEIWLDAQEKNRNNRRYNFNREQKEAYEDAIRAAEAEAGPDAYKDRPKWAETIKRHYDAAAEAKSGENAEGSNSVKASKNAADALRSRLEMHSNEDHGMEVDDEGNVTVTDPEKAEFIFNAAAGDTQRVTNRPGEGSSDLNKDIRDELKDLRGKLGVPDTREQNLKDAQEAEKAARAPQGEVFDDLSAAEMTFLTRRSNMETVKLPKDREDIGFNVDREGTLRITDRDKAIETVTKMRDAWEDNSFSRDSARNTETLNRALDKLSGDSTEDAPEAVSEAPEAAEAPAAPESAPEAPEAPAADAPETTEDDGEAALAAVGVRRTEPVALPGEKFPPTRQQQDVIDAVVAGKDTVVQAKAGAGKTTTLQAIATRIPDKKVVYVAFNKSVQTEAEGRMPGNVEPRTGHSISFNWVGKDVQSRFKGENGIKQLKLDEDIAKHIGITGSYKGDPGSDQDMLYPEDIASAAMKAVDKFAFNAEDDISEDHFPDSMDGTSEEAKAAVLDAANKIWADINAPDGRIQLTQDHMRKMWALSRPDLTKAGSGLRRAAEVLFIDEAQDTPPVLAKVVSDQKMQKVIVGDADQAIYGFSGATDYLSKAEKDIELPLNRSWRFGPEVADAGNRYLQLLGSKGRVVGGGPSSNVRLDGGTMTDADAVLVRTNSGALGEIMEETNRGRIVGVEKKTRDKFNQLADTMDWLMSKDKDRTPIARPDKVLPELSHYKNWEHVLKEAERGDNVSLNTFVNLQEKHGSDGIRKAMAKVVAVDGKPAGSSKGVGGNLGGVSMDDTGSVTVANGKAYQNKDDLKAAGFKFLPDPSGDLIRSGANKGQPRKSWQAVGTPEQRAATVKRFADRIGAVTPEDGGEPVKPDVVITTAHKAKGLEWGKVRIGSDFRQPKSEPNFGKVTFPDPEELRLAYVAVTRAETDLDPGSLKWIYEHTSENGGTPEPQDKPAEQNEVTEPPISAADDSDYVANNDEVLEPANDTVVAPEDEVVVEDEEEDSEVVIEEPQPEVPETEETPETDGPTEQVTPEAEDVAEPEVTSQTPDAVQPTPGLDEDGLTPAEAAYAGKLEKAISDGYRTGIGNVKALEERLDGLYRMGRKRLGVPEKDEKDSKAPETIPESNEPASAPEPVEEPDAPTEPEADVPTDDTVSEDSAPVEVPEEEEPTQGDASDGETGAETPTDIDTMEATLEELSSVLDRVKEEGLEGDALRDATDDEVYLLYAEDGSIYEIGLGQDDDGSWSYVLADSDGTELERYDSAVDIEASAATAFNRINKRDTDDAVTPSNESTDEAPEASEETVSDAERVEPPEEVPAEEAPEEVPATGEEAPAPAPAPTTGTKTHPAKLKAGNYPDGTQLKSARTGDTIEKTDGKWHVAGSPNESADPMDLDTPMVSEMPALPEDSFAEFDGNLESLTPGDIVRTVNGAQASVIGMRQGKAMVVPHGVPAGQRALRPNVVALDPTKIGGVNKFDTAPEGSEAPAADTSTETPTIPTRTRTRRTGLPKVINDAEGNETKVGDRVMTAIGQGEVVAVKPSAGPQGSVVVRLDDGKEKTFRANKFTNAAGAETIEGDDPASMEIGASGTASDGRKFLVGKGNKPIFKGDRVALEDGSVGTVTGIYAGVKSANLKMDDGSTPRKKVSVLDAIDYEAPEKGPDAPEDNGGGDGGSPDAAPQSGPAGGTAAASSAVPELVFGDSEVSMKLQDFLEGGGTSAEGLTQAVSLMDDDSGALTEMWNNGNSLVTLARGDGTPQENAEAASELLNVLFAGSLMQQFDETVDRSVKMNDLFQMWAPQSGELKDRFHSTLGKLSDAVGTREDIDSPEVASYDGSADFSSFDWATSKFNPLSEKAKSIGYLENEGTKLEGVRRGTRVRNSKTGEYGFLASKSAENGLGQEAPEGKVSVVPSAADPKAAKGDRVFSAEHWDTADVEVADGEWSREAIDFSDADSLDAIAKRAEEAYPGMVVALDGITTERGAAVMNSLSTLIAKYPMLKSGLQSVSTGDGDGALAAAINLRRDMPNGEYGPSRMQIDNTESDEEVIRATKVSSGTGWFTPVKEGDEFAHTVYHEAAHILDTISGGITEDDVVEILKSAYPDFRAGNTKSLRMLLSRAKIARYATYGDRLDVSELIAEAFADAELNATDAWPVSKLLHRYLLERLQEG